MRKAAGDAAAFDPLLRNDLPGDPPFRIGRFLRPDCEEISVRRYNELMEDLKDQRKLGAYQCPQVVLERIEPGWLKSVKVFGKSGILGILRRK